nr:BrnT family toxin [Methylobacterium sp. Leaf456]
MGLGLDGEPGLGRLGGGDESGAHAASGRWLVQGGSSQQSCRDDPFVMTAPDGIEGGELRWRAIGSMGSVAVLVVVNTVREGDEDGREIEIVRIISARRADRTERSRYERETREF